MIGASIAQDITAQVQSDAAIAESEERYRALFASAPMAIFVCDRNAVIQDYNNHAVELWGREPVRGVEQHVLLVEDENMVALLLEDMLAELGHTVVGPVARLDKTLETAQREAFDVAILDVHINGGEVLSDRRRACCSRHPFVFSTGYDKKSVPAPYNDRPALQKPFQRHDLEKLFAELSPYDAGLGRQQS